MFSHIKGVDSVVSGFAGDFFPAGEENPTYESVCSGKTGYAEVVKISFSANEISYADILHIFFSVHNPTTLNRQGNDVGTQYRSVIFYADEKQKAIAKEVVDEFNQEKIYADSLVTEIAALEKFYPAEEYHQHYFEKNPEKAYCQAVIAPKLSDFRKKFQKFYR